ncbi:MAG: non-homologous end-joining DNA ligase [Alphaproteobacteria bacterium]
MLATEVDAPFTRAGWVFEEKYDGYRVIAYKEGARATLTSRNGRDCGDRFPEILASVARLPARTAAIDGEAVVLDEHLVSRFESLQKKSAPVLFAAFDCLWLDGRDLREEPLRDRRAALEKLVEGSDRVFPARRLPDDGVEAHRNALARGIEGLVGKDEASAYRSGRSRSWLKVKIKQGEEFVVGGFTPGRGGRTHFGSLLLGAFDARGLRYVGRVGTGFDERTLAAIASLLRPLVVDRPAFVDPPREPGATWVEPRFVAQVAFAEWTSEGRLRQPAFLGLRDDKDPRDCLLPERLR